MNRSIPFLSVFIFSVITCFTSFRPVVGASAGTAAQRVIYLWELPSVLPIGMTDSSQLSGIAINEWYSTEEDPSKIQELIGAYISKNSAARNLRLLNKSIKTKKQAFSKARRKHQACLTKIQQRRDLIRSLGEQINELQAALPQEQEAIESLWESRAKIYPKIKSKEEMLAAEQEVLNNWDTKRKGESRIAFNKRKFQKNTQEKKVADLTKEIEGLKKTLKSKRYKSLNGYESIEDHKATLAKTASNTGRELVGQIEALQEEINVLKAEAESKERIKSEAERLHTEAAQGSQAAEAEVTQAEANYKKTYESFKHYCNKRLIPYLLTPEGIREHYHNDFGFLPNGRKNNINYPSDFVESLADDLKAYVTEQARDAYGDEAALDTLKKQVTGISGQYGELDRAITDEVTRIRDEEILTAAVAASAAREAEADDDARITANPLSLSDEEEEAAAVKLQSFVRGRAARKRVADIRAEQAAQVERDRLAAEQEAEAAAQAKAARNIQRVLRGRAVRKELNARAAAAVTLQSLARGHRARKQLAQIREAAAQKVAALRLQSLVRGRAARTRVAGIRTERAAQAERDRIAAEQEAAALRLQSIARGQAARTRVAGIRAERAAEAERYRIAAEQEAAALRLQSIARGQAARKRVASIHEERAEQAERERLAAEQANAASVRIQAAYRRYKEAPASDSNMGTLHPQGELDPGTSPGRQAPASDAPDHHEEVDTPEEPTEEEELYFQGEESRRQIAEALIHELISKAKHAKDEEASKAFEDKREVMRLWAQLQQIRKSIAEHKSSADTLSSNGYGGHHIYADVMARIRGGERASTEIERTVTDIIRAKLTEPEFPEDVDHSAFSEAVKEAYDQIISDTKTTIINRLADTENERMPEGFESKFVDSFNSVEKRVLDQFIIERDLALSKANEFRNKNIMKKTFEAIKQDAADARQAERNRIAAAEQKADQFRNKRLEKKALEAWKQSQAIAKRNSKFAAFLEKRELADGFNRFRNNVPVPEEASGQEAPVVTPHPRGELDPPGSESGAGLTSPGRRDEVSNQGSPVGTSPGKRDETSGEENETVEVEPAVEPVQAPGTKTTISAEAPTAHAQISEEEPASYWPSKKQVAIGGAAAIGTVIAGIGVAKSRKWADEYAHIPTSKQVQDARKAGLSRSALPEKTIDQLPWAVRMSVKFWRAIQPKRFNRVTTAAAAA